MPEFSTGLPAAGSPPTRHSCPNTTCLPSVSLPGMSFSASEALITSQQRCHDCSFPEDSLYLGSFQTTLVFTVKFYPDARLMLTEARCCPEQLSGLSFPPCGLVGFDESIALCLHPCSVPSQTCPPRLLEREERASASPAPHLTSWPPA